MVRKTEVIARLVDDLDGGPAAESVKFAFDGVSYEIDLSKRNAKALRSDMTKWVEHARKVRPAAGRGRTARSAGRPTSEAPAIRAWAAEQGIAVPTRGRLPKTVVEQYRSA
jgi:hypothetical protein